MDGQSRWWLLLPSEIRSLPADLAVIVALTVLTTISVFLPVLNETPLRVVFGLPFVLFVPGYAFIAALFPEAGESPADDDARAEPERSGRDGIDGLERVALAFGTSIAISPLLGLLLNFTPWGIRLVPIVVTLGGFTLLTTAIAAQRRWNVAPEDRFRVPYREWLDAAHAELFDPDGTTDAALNVLLVVSILLAVGSVGYAVSVPKDSERFTEFYLLTEGEDGELVADGYPSEFVRGQSRQVVVGIGNQEHSAQNYSVVVELQRVQFENNSSTVLAEERLDGFRTGLNHNDTYHYNYTIAPTMTGDRLRLAFLLFRGDAPANPRVDNAYREVHLWVNVSRPN
jgi:uncharacterized membrane protein